MATSPRKQRKRKRRRISLVLLLLLAAAGYYVGNRYAKQAGHDGLFSLLSSSSSNYSNSRDPDVAISLEIDAEAMAKINQVREDALARGVIVQPDDPYVPCVIRYNGEEIKAEIRLKGKMLDHVEGDKWSFRVKTKKGDAFLGMKRFTLQHPGTRQYLSEWVYHRIAEEEGLIALRYQFINLTLNDDDLGVYAVEEHFGQEVLGQNERLPGPIFRFNPSLFWYFRINEANGIDIAEEYTKFQSSYLDAFTEGSLLKDADLKRNFEQAGLADGAVPTRRG